MNEGREEGLTCLEFLWRLGGKDLEEKHLYIGHKLGWARWAT
jgi:hypothetical protein